MQFVYAVVLMTNWRILARRSLGEKAVDDGVFRIAVCVVGALAIPGPIFYGAFDAFSDEQHEAFRLLQFGIALPTLIFAVSLVAKARALCRPAHWPWRDPAFFTLADVARAVRARRRHGVPHLGLGHAHARPLSRGHHRGQRLERRHALDLRARGTRPRAGLRRARPGR